MMTACAAVYPITARSTSAAGFSSSNVQLAIVD
jgi:hypothetical protein